MLFGDKNDLGHITNLMLAIRKAKFTLEGDEVVALGETVRWLTQLHKKVKDGLTMKVAPPPPDRLEEEPTQLTGGTPQDDQPLAVPE